MRIFVTGSSSCVAQALLPRLCGQPQVEEVVGIDLKPAALDLPRFRPIVGDVRTSALPELMRGCRAVVHLAFAVMRDARSDEELRSNNVDGTLGVFAAARAAGIGRVVNLSSVSVYGSGTALEESAALLPSPAFPYACHKAEIEAAAAQAFPEVLHLRSHLIFGAHAQPFLRTMSQSRIYIAPPKPVPVMQVVHEADVATAILAALEQDARGAFNIAAPEVVTLPELLRHDRGLMLGVPLGAVRAAAKLAQRLGNKDELTWLDVLDTTLTVQCRRARELLGWVPAFSAWQALRDTRAA